jgi:hypothetical protein
MSGKKQDALDHLNNIHKEQVLQFMKYFKSKV